MSQIGMNGQWIGRYSGSSTGFATVNIDELETGYQGSASLIEDDQKLPASVVFFRTSSKDRKLSFRTDFINFVHPRKGTFHIWNEIKGEFDEQIEMSEFVEVEAEWNEEFLWLSWKSQKGDTGSCRLLRSQAGLPSELTATQMGWSDFKQYVSSHGATRKQVFRGQNKPWRLRSSFHRSGRADLFRYVTEDIHALHRHVSARTKHLFNLEIPDQNGAFYNLVQHHGYPTPLLDWTYSPYVAAFFAYRGISKETADVSKPEDAVRIHVFDLEQWVKAFPLPFPPKVLSAHLNIAFLEFIAMDNDRLVPQQSISMITNVDDVESFIRQQDQTRTFLRAIDLPVADRRQAIVELSYMGITAGSLFPGVQGTCEEFAERNFKF
jgi:hypothetical protein